MKQMARKKQTQPLTAEQLYKSNQKKAKVFKVLTPVFFWFFTALAALFFVLTIKNSIGNILDIIAMLDKKALTGQQLADNYKYLVDKWGEWVIMGDDGGSLRLQFIDIRNALFSGMMIIFIVLTITCAVVAIVLGKIVFPKLVQLYQDSNQDMVNVATLQTNAEIKKRKNKDEEWF